MKLHVVLKDGAGLTRGLKPVFPYTRTFTCVV
ncbi:hypothetical protein LINGRAPRIM_LOCUS903 [Linum grandiflorum]